MSESVKKEKNLTKRPTKKLVSSGKHLILWLLLSAAIGSSLHTDGRPSGAGQGTSKGHPSKGAATPGELGQVRLGHTARGDCLQKHDSKWDGSITSSNTAASRYSTVSCSYLKVCLTYCDLLQALSVTLSSQGFVSEELHWHTCKIIQKGLAAQYCKCHGLGWMTCSFNQHLSYLIIT